jgi:ATP-binding cassette subfamily B multidrug efflux pump
VIERGRIVEEGTHAELVARGGVYAGLWSRQSGGFLADRSTPEVPDAEPTPDRRARQVSDALRG